MITKPEVARIDVHLNDYIGRKNIVIAFYAFAFTATWEKQIPSYEAQRAEFDGLNSQVLAISCDPVFSNRAWGKSLGGISYPLLSDFWPHGEVCKKYGVFDEKVGRPQRAIFVIDMNGVLRWIKKYEIGVLPDNAELFAELKKL